MWLKDRFTVFHSRPHLDLFANISHPDCFWRSKTRTNHISGNCSVNPEKITYFYYNTKYFPNKRSKWSCFALLVTGDLNSFLSCLWLQSWLYNFLKTFCQDNLQDKRPWDFLHFRWHFLFTFFSSFYRLQKQTVALIFVSSVFQREFFHVWSCIKKITSVIFFLFQ